MRNLKLTPNTLTLKFNQITSVQEFISNLRKCYYNAKQFENTLPYLINESNSYELNLALTDAIPIAKRHTDRLVQIFDSIHTPISSLKCEDIERYFDELRLIGTQFQSGFSLDNAIILQCQKIMSHDIESLTQLLDFVNETFDTSVKHYLNTAIAEEKNAHSILTEIAFQSIYFEQAV